MFYITPPLKMKRAQHGFTLLELAIVLSLLTLLTIQFVPLQDDYNESIAEQYTLSGYQDLAHAAKTFYVQSGGQVWPSDLATLLDAGLLPGYTSSSAMRFTNGFGNEFQVQPVGNEVRISSVVNTLSNAQAVVYAWGPLASYDIATRRVDVVVLRPGHEVSHDALLPRDGSRPMVGSLDMQANDMVNGNIVYSSQIETTRVNAENAGLGLVKTDTVDTILMSAESFEYKP